MSGKPNRCIYCGDRCAGDACRLHAELLKVDPARGATDDRTDTGREAEAASAPKGSRR